MLLILRVDMLIVVTYWMKEVMTYMQVQYDVIVLSSIVMLCSSDVAKGLNSYYCIQLIVVEHAKPTYVVFTSWGRVGTSHGSSKIYGPFQNVSGAKEVFMERFLDKTGNEWEDRNNFVKQPRKMYPLEIEMEEYVKYSLVSCDRDEKEDKKGPEIPSKLDQNVLELMKILFDVEVMQQQMRMMEIDTSRMPLGKLSRQHLKSAYPLLESVSTS